MKQYKSWKKLLVLTLILTFTPTASLQASEGVSEDTTGAEEEIIVEDPGLEDVTPAVDAAPEAEISSQDLVVSTITTVPAETVPLATSADSDEEVNGQGEESQTGKKKVTFYLDWNGIDGLFGKCLTCTREYADGTTPKFTAEDAAVYGLNYTDEYGKVEGNLLEGELYPKGELDGKPSEEQWKILQQKWKEKTFNGYKFLGWSTEPKGGELITSDTDVEDGMSFYAYWEKDGKSNKDFQRVDPEAGPLESIRIVAGAGTQFRSGTLHASRHATVNSSFTLNLFYTPVRAELKNVTWNVTVCESAAPSLQMLFGSKKNGETVEVKADSEAVVKDAIQMKAEGCSLTITSTDGKEHVITVSAAAEGTDGKVFTAPSEATLSFTHSWGSGKVTKEARCEEKGEIQYICAECEETKTEDIPALQHVYNKNKNLNRDDKTYYTVTTEEAPTCTKEGLNEYTYKCLREGCGYEVTEEGKVPALGHAWSETVKTPTTCKKDTETRYCTRCGMQEVSLVPADNQDLHAWKETYRYHETCMSDIVYEQCAVCRKTRSRKEAADNPDRHSYAFESRVSVDCGLVIYTFRCVHGCGTAQVMLKKEENHNWGDWTTTTSWDKTTGTMKRIRKHTCLRCGTEETENLDGTAEEIKDPDRTAEETEDPGGAAGETENPGVSEGEAGDSDGTGKETESSGSTVDETENSGDTAGEDRNPGDTEETENSKNAAVETDEPSDTVREAGNPGDKEEKIENSDGTEETENSENAAGKTNEPGDTIEETKAPSVTQAQTNPVAVSTNNVPVSQPMSYIAGAAAPVAVAPTALASADTEEKTVWQTVEKKKSYFSENSEKKAGWKKVGKKKYYFNKNGRKKTGWQKISGKKYYFGKDGAMKTGWQTIKGKKYYFGKNGVMRTGKQKIGKKIYTFGKNGALK